MQLRYSRTVAVGRQDTGRDARDGNSGRGSSRLRDYPSSRRHYRQAPAPLCDGVTREGYPGQTVGRGTGHPAGRRRQPIPVMEEHVPRTPWRRRRTTDSPRPAGRRWAGRLRRSGTLARQALLVRVGRRDRRRRSRRTDLVLPAHRYTDRAAPSGYGSTAGSPRPRRRSPRSSPVSPALAPADPGRRRAGDVDPAAARRAHPRPPGQLRAGQRLHPGQPRAGPAAPSSWPCTARSAIAALCLIACVVFDGLDGALARKLGVSSPFGAQMDSLADMCSFGLAAPVVVYASLAGTVPPAAAASACVLRRRLRRDPAGPVQRLAEGRQVLLRRADHDGRGGAGADRADRAAGARHRCWWPAWRCWPSRWCPASRTRSWPGW